MEFLFPLFSIIIINILLSGDNALVIALASRKLAPKQQRKVMIWGSAAAIGLRVGLTLIAVFILKVPYLQMAGGVLLFWIAIKLMTDQKHDQKVEAKRNLWDAIKTIIVADAVMSLDNIIAIIGVAKGDIVLLVAGLMISIPIIIWGSQFIGVLIQKYPIIITIGSAFLGWTAGEMIIGDRQLLQIVEWHSWMNMVVPSIFAVFVLIIGNSLSNKRQRVKNKE